MIIIFLFCCLKLKAKNTHSSIETDALLKLPNRAIKLYSYHTDIPTVQWRISLTFCNDVYSYFIIKCIAFVETVMPLFIVFLIENIKKLLRSFWWGSRLSLIPLFIRALPEALGVEPIVLADWLNKEQLSRELNSYLSVGPRVETESGDHSQQATVHRAVTLAQIQRELNRIDTWKAINPQPTVNTQCSYPVRLGLEWGKWHAAKPGENQSYGNPSPPLSTDAENLRRWKPQSQSAITKRSTWCHRNF